MPTVIQCIFFNFIKNVFPFVLVSVEVVRFYYCLMSLPLGVPSFKSLFAASDSLRTFTNDIRTFGELYWHLIV